MSSIQFGFVSVSAAICTASIRNQFVHLVKEITDACSLPNTFKAILLMLKEPKMFPEYMLDMIGIYLLTTETDIVAMGFVYINPINGMHLDGIYVPKRFRRQGYAVMLLNLISTLYTNDDKVGVYSPVAHHAISLFEKAAWVPVNNPSKRDGTIDYVPQQCVETYNMDKIKPQPYSAKDAIKHRLPLIIGVKCLQKN